MYGTFAVQKGIDGFLYMYASSAGGLKVARTEEFFMTDRNHVSRPGRRRNVRSYSD